MQQLIKGRLLWFTDKPSIKDSNYSYVPDGALLIDNGKIIASGLAKDITVKEGTEVHDYGNQLIVPGFIDTHIHFPQCEIIASYGEQLLDWLNRYTFPSELKFADQDHAEQVATFFMKELFRNGTTSAMVYCTVHPQSVNALFAEAKQYGARILAGKVMMDRHAPESLLDTPEVGFEDSAALIEKWHNKGRLSYVVTPRFAPTSTIEQLNLAGELLRQYPSVYLQTHLSENKGELAWVAELFPEAENYLDVYDKAGLLGPRSVFGHGIYLSEAELQRLSQTQSVVAFCPTSNLFLGSGLLDLQRLEAAGVRASMATDVGGGTSFSMLTTLGEAYKILQLQDQSMAALEGFYRITLGNAKSLGLDDNIGQLAAGYEADFVVLDTHKASALSAFRVNDSLTLEEELFTAQTLGDERWISATYVNGIKVFEQEASS